MGPTRAIPFGWASFDGPGATMSNIGARARRGENTSYPEVGRIHKRDRAPRAGIGPLLALGAVPAVLLLLMAAMASAAPVASFSAPYSGKAIHTQSYSSQGCSASVSVGKAAGYVLSTGLGTMKASTKAGPCATADSQAGYDAYLGVSGLKFTAASSGTHSVAASWKITWTGSLTMSSTAANAGGQATLEVYLQTSITDSSTGKTTSAGTVFLYQKDLQSAGTVSASGTASTGSSTLSGYSLVSGHTYTITAQIVIDLQSTVPQGAGAGSSVTVAADFGSGSNGATLVSVVVK